MKIALCFLTYSNIIQNNLWQTFVNQTDKYNCYLHNKNDFIGFFKKYSIENKVKTKYGHISLVKATINLFREALLDYDNKYFILLSDTCIPLYGPGKTYNIITKENNNIITSYFSQECERYHSLSFKEFFDENKFSKQSQWMCLTRNTADFFANNDFIDIFGEESRFPDEHYFINIINMFGMKYTNKRLTYVNWKEKSDLPLYRSLPKTYSIITDKILQEMRDSGCVFARKIAHNCTLPVNYLKEIKEDSL